MKYISSYKNKTRARYPSEIVGTEITDWHHQRQLPRHISAPETQSYRDRQNIVRTEIAPRVCSIDPFKPTKTNVALDILKYQLWDLASKEKHLENVRANLKRRLEVAKLQENSQLVDILQDEYRQLETNK